MLIAAIWIWFYQSSQISEVIFFSIPENKSSQICEVYFFSIPEIHATGFNYQNEDEKVTLSFPSTLQTGKRHGFCKIPWIVSSSKEIFCMPFFSSLF